MTNTDEDDDDTHAKKEHQLLSPLSPNFEVFLVESLWARLKYKKVQKMDSMLTLLVRYHPNDCADLAAAISRASSGNADPL
jgi:hypothetical protein